MGVRVEVRDGESLAEAVKRFRESVWRQGPPGAGRKRPKWHKRPLDYYLKPSELARRDDLRDAFETYAGECSRRRWLCLIRRRTKQRKERFGDAPVVCKYPRPRPLPGWA
ncbi:30S ribosomal protein S21 [Limnoglobus roseus]|uniref:30S ribosomal protein S21 n=1 Tax=Limnoglobus roseus TaxID=2598579 RepID=A0A5C1ADU2_9BACT|nr:30S ribosomal protein S21 [Limnoglobus roseus]QEL15872.1 30S ribosomal protein S21 [Limnoglobus roseus]